METFTAYTVEGINEFTFDPLVKNSTVHFLHFTPKKESPEKVRMVISIYQKDNTLLEKHVFDLEIDYKKKCYENSHIGLKLDGLHQKMIFEAFNTENGLPLNKICIGVAVAKIKDGNDDDNGGIHLKPISPNSLLTECYN
ncbi:hypothetical protein [Flavobacterium sp. UBA7682]|uniref:hypothetical protein n=1 Tax=Flavobacterium sp. UBA7682 TaxID=1946560 RepID=UPI0025C55B14|nr:hypothetical protein [Flavobacterium sp. UBA7682]